MNSSNGAGMRQPMQVAKSAMIFALVASFQAGCIFSSSFGQGSSDGPPGEDMGVIDAGTEDMGPAPGDMNSPLDMPDEGGNPEDLGTSEDLGAVSCMDHSQCELGMTQCDDNTKQCVPCPPDTASFSCADASGAPQCGVVRSATQCTPEPVICTCDEEATRCPGDPSQIALTLCEGSQLCPSETRVDAVCSTMETCRDVQRMCPGQDEIETFDCGSTNQVRCTLAARPTPGMAREGRRVAMGLDDVVVSHGTRDFPDLYERESEGKWSVVTGVNVPTDAFKEAIEQWTAEQSVGAIDMTSWTQHGLALAMGDGASPYMASTARVSYTTMGGTPDGVNVVIVLRKLSTGWTYMDTIFPPFNERNGFGQALAINDNQLLIGSRGAMGDNLSMYKLESDGNGNHITREFGCDVRFGVDMSVGLATLDSQTVLVSSCAEGVCACQQGRSTEQIAGISATIESLAVVDDRLLIREGRVATLYQISNPAGIMTGVQLREYESFGEDGAKVVRFKKEAGATSDVQILLTADREVHTTPDGHSVLTEPPPTGPFTNYLRYAPVLDDLEFMIADADINTRGEVVMVVQRDNRGSIFFASSD